MNPTWAVVEWEGLSWKELVQALGDLTKVLFLGFGIKTTSTKNQERSIILNVVQKPEAEVGITKGMLAGLSAGPTSRAAVLFRPAPGLEECCPGKQKGTGASKGLWQEEIGALPCPELNCQTCKLPVEWALKVPCKEEPSGGWRARWHSYRHHHSEVRH